MKINPSFSVGEVIYHKVTNIKGQIRSFEVYTEDEIFYNVFLATGEIIPLKEFEIMNQEEHDIQKLINGNEE
jgi:hypothetical protein